MHRAREGRHGRVRWRHRHLGDECEDLVRLAGDVGGDAGTFGLELGTPSQRVEFGRGGRVRCLLTDDDPAERVRRVGRAMFELCHAGLVEQNVDDEALRGRDQHVVDECLSLVAAAVASDQLHLGTCERQPEDAGVRGVRDEEADDLIPADVERQLGLAVHEEDVSEPAHRDVVGAGTVVPGNPSVLDEHVVHGNDHFAVDRGPVVSLRGLDDDVAGQAHVLRVVLADVRVIPVQALVGKTNPVGEMSTDRDRLLRFVRDAVVPVLEPKPVPVDRCRDVAVVRHVDDDLRSLPDAQGGSRDRAVVGEPPHRDAPDALRHGSDPQVELVAVGQVDLRRRVGRKQPGNVRRVRSAAVVLVVLHAVAPVSRFVHASSMPANPPACRGRGPSGARRCEPGRVEIQVDPRDPVAIELECLGHRDPCRPGHERVQRHGPRTVNDPPDVVEANRAEEWCVPLDQRDECGRAVGPIECPAEDEVVRQDPGQAVEVAFAPAVVIGVDEPVRRVGHASTSCY